MLFRPELEKVEGYQRKGLCGVHADVMLLDLNPSQSERGIHFR